MFRTIGRRVRGGRWCGQQMRGAGVTLCSPGRRRTGLGTKSDALEGILGEIEGGAAEALRVIVDDGVWPIPEPHRWAVAAWVASQALCTPTQRQALDEIADILLKLQIGAGGGRRSANCSATASATSRSTKRSRNDGKHSATSAHIVSGPTRTRICKTWCECCLARPRCSMIAPGHLSVSSARRCSPAITPAPRRPRKPCQTLEVARFWRLAVALGQ